MNEENASKYANDRKISEKTDAFLEFSNKFFMDEKIESKVTDYTTQPYYNTMVKEKQRLAENNIKMRTIVKPIFYNHDVDVIKQGDAEALTNERKTLTIREFLHEGKTIFREKRREVVYVNYLKNEVDGKGECPNCGYIGKVSSFIDGCNQCGAKFQVKEFEPKVSAFNIITDAEKLAENISRWSIAGVYSTIFILAALLIFGFAMLPMEGVGGINPELGEIFVNIAVYLAEPIIRFIFVMTLVMSVLALLFIDKHDKNITGKDVVEPVIKDFLPMDFFQNVEMRLTEIFLAKEAEEVEAYADCDLTEIVNSHRTVVDFHMDTLHFLEANEEKDCYVIKAKAEVSLYNFSENRMKKNKENVTFTMKLGKANKSVTFIKAYKCGRCGSTVDIMKGGVCEYCGNKLSLEDVGMRFDCISFEQGKNHLALEFILQTAGIFVICFLINAVIPNLLTGQTAIKSLIDILAGR